MSTLGSVARGLLGLAFAFGLTHCGKSTETAGFDPVSTDNSDVEDQPDETDAPPAEEDPPESDDPPPATEDPPEEPEDEPEAPWVPQTCSGKDGQKGSRVVNVGLRTAILHVPENYDPTQGAMLILNYHGFGSADWQQPVLTKMSESSDEHGYIVAYPAGVAMSWNAGACCGTAWVDAIDDVQFTSDLIDEIASDYCIDDRQIFATGMSNGGFMSHMLGCHLSERIAAIAPVAGVLGIDPSECTPARPVPVMQIHGTSDILVSYEGGAGTLGGLMNFASVDDTMAFWRDNNDCADAETTYYSKGDSICIEWSDCEEDAAVILCTIDEGGHTWPGGLPIPSGKTTKD